MYLWKYLCNNFLTSEVFLILCHDYIILPLPRHSNAHYATGAIFNLLFICDPFHFAVVSLYWICKTVMHVNGGLIVQEALRRIIFADPWESNISLRKVFNFRNFSKGRARGCNSESIASCVNSNPNRRLYLFPTFLGPWGGCPKLYSIVRASCIYTNVHWSRDSV